MDEFNKDLYEECIRISAQSWCQPHTENIVMNVELGLEFANVLYMIFDGYKDEPVDSPEKIASRISWSDIVDYRSKCDGSLFKKE